MLIYIYLFIHLFIPAPLLLPPPQQKKLEMPCLAAFTIRSMIWMHCCIKHICYFKFSSINSLAPFGFFVWFFFISLFIYCYCYSKYMCNIMISKSDWQEEKNMKGCSTSRKAQWVANCAPTLILKGLYLRESFSP